MELALWPLVFVETFSLESLAEKCSLIFLVQDTWKALDFEFAIF